MGKHDQCHIHCPYTMPLHHELHIKSGESHPNDKAGSYNGKHALCSRLANMPYAADKCPLALPSSLPMSPYNGSRITVTYHSDKACSYNGAHTPCSKHVSAVNDREVMARKNSSRNAD